MKSKLRNMQLAELEIAKNFVMLCQQNNFTYFMLGGAMLGAVRHRGFIPWDDDIDFGMPRADYERLKKFILTKGGNDISVLDFTLENSHDYPMKLVDKNIRIINRNVESQNTAYAWIDIFPVDGFPNNRFARWIHGFVLLADRAFLKLSQMSTGVALENPYRTGIEKTIIFIGKKIKIDRILSERFLMKRLDKDLKRYPFGKSKFAVNFMGAYKLKETFSTSLYSSYKLYQFEDAQFVGLEDFDTYLHGMYGDYMTPPEPQKRDKHKVEVE